MIKRFGFVVLILLLSLSAQAAYYTWTDERGVHFTDKLDLVPAKYQRLIREEETKVEKNGIGYYLDDYGIYHFYEKGAPPPKPAPQASQGTAAPAKFTAPGLLNTAPDDSWRGSPNPEMVDAKVKKIISGDTILLEDGTKLKYIGIVFPADMKGNHPLHREAKEYQEKMLAGKTVQVLFGPRRLDEKGRTLGFVFLGTDILVNADLVMNGYAMVKTEPPNTEYRELFQRLENDARKNQLGVWKNP